MPKVSVNIPCFNSEKFIRETLKSVLNQTFEDFEIIIIDDGSTDNTKDIISTFKDPRIKYFYKKNEGLAFTRNKAVIESQGEYIAFLDHDDIWLSDKLKEQIALFGKENNLGLVFSDIFILQGNKKSKFTYFDLYRPKRGYIFEDLLLESSNFIPLSTVVIPRRIFEKVGFFNRAFKMGEDLELFLRIAEQHEVDYINKPLAVYRVHENNFSRNKEIYARDHFDILDFYQIKMPELFDKNGEKILRKKADISAELANFFAINLRRSQALSCFNASLKYHRNIKIVVKKYTLLILGNLFYRILDLVIKYINSLKFSLRCRKN